MHADAAPQSSRGVAGATTPVASLEQPLRIDRATRGQVSGPVPWVMVGFGKVWAWDQTVGLVRLTEAEKPGRPVFEWDALTPDGRYLYYTSIELRDNGRVVFDLVTGKWQSGPLRIGDNSFIGSYPRLSVGQRLDVYRFNLQGKPPNYLNGRYLVHRGADDVIELPIDDHFNFSRDGIPVQFSPTGQTVAISHFRAEGGRHSTSVVDIETGHATKYDGVAVSTCGAWSPCGARLLLRGIQDQLPSVIDQAAGVIRSLKEVVFADPAWLYSGPLVSGWLDETRVLISGTFGRRIILATLDVDTGERVDLLDLPKPSGEYGGIRYAPFLAQADPTIVGPVQSGTP